MAAAHAATARMTAAAPDAASRLGAEELLALAAAALGLDPTSCRPVRVFGRGSTHRRANGQKTGGWCAVLMRAGDVVAEASGREDDRPDVTSMEVRAITEGLLLAAAYGAATMPVLLLSGQEWVVRPRNKVNSRAMTEPVRVMREAATSIGLTTCRPTAEDHAASARCMEIARAIARG